MLRDDHARFERDRLPVAGHATGLQANGLELRFDVRRGLLESRRPDLASFERVGGEILDVAPPALALGGRVLENEGDNSDQEVSKSHHCRELYRLLRTWMLRSRAPCANSVNEPLSEADRWFETPAFLQECQEVRRNSSRKQSS